MPAAGLMTPLDVVDAGLSGYETGKQMAQQQDQLARQKKAQAAQDEAQQAFAKVLDASKAEWALNGAEGEYKPSDSTMLKAAEARGHALAKNGDWQSYLQNEAAVQGQRVRIRGQALQRYQQDGDIEALTRSIYPTIFDGKEIVRVEPLEGGRSPRKDLPPAPPQIRIHLSDGSKVIDTPQNIVAGAKQLLTDPVATSQKEIEFNFKAMLERYKADRDIEVEGVKGAEQRKTKAQEAAAARSLADATNRSREAVAAGNNAATLAAAETGAKGRVTAARISAGGKGEAGAAKATRANVLQTMIEKSYGTATSGGFGSSRLGNENTAKILEGAQAYLADNEHATEAEAINAAVAALRKRGVKIDSGSLMDAN